MNWEKIAEGLAAFALGFHGFFVVGFVLTVML